MTGAAVEQPVLDALAGLPPPTLAMVGDALTVADGPLRMLGAAMVEASYCGVDRTVEIKVGITVDRLARMDDAGLLGRLEAGDQPLWHALAGAVRLARAARASVEA